MALTLESATPASLRGAVEEMALWQDEDGSVQLHPGDLGWNWSLGEEELVRAVRIWRRAGQVLAVGMASDDGLIRMAVAPSAGRDDELAARLLADLSDDHVLPGGIRTVEARFGGAFRGLLVRRGWTPDEPWTPLVFDLGRPVAEPDLRVEVVGERDAAERVAVHRASFTGSTFTLERWRAMAACPPYRRARCLVGYDQDGVAVAAVTVWSAGPGRPGLVEPLGVHQDHRGNGYGVAISVAAAAALQEMGSSSATVCTPSSNIGGVATYVAAGFRRLPDVTDFRRPG